jgi:hypothetical protein
MNTLKFEDLKPRISTALTVRLNALSLNQEGGFTLVDGFIMQPLSNEISGSLVLGGPSIPLVAVVGKTSGQMYYFALKALLPDISI